MFPLRCVLAFTLLLGKYVKGSSIAEEINFEVSNMKESAKNDPRVYLLQEMGENGGDDTGKENENFEDAETAPSEIIETHVLPEEGNLEDPNGQVKRPRRRRRRRRRKRPKPVTNSEELEPYYTLPEEEIKRKPIKYQPPENIDELVTENSNLPRRRNTKRRRRPLKRPIVEDYPAMIDGGNPEYVNNTEEPIAELSSNVQADENREQNKMKAEYQEENDGLRNDNPLFTDTDITHKVRQKIKENERETGSIKENSKIQYSVAEDEFSKKLTPGEHRSSQQNQNKGNEFNTFKSQEETHTFENQYKEIESPKVLSSIDNRKSGHHHKEAETLKYFDELNGTVRRRKRPYMKSENSTATAEIQKEIPSEQKTSETSQKVFKNHDHWTAKGDIKTAGGKENENNKFNFVENHKMKNNDQAKRNETNKKEIFKLRRLPPISAILRHVKGRPVQNETAHTKVPTKIGATNKFKGSVSNEILTHVAMNDVQKSLQNETNDEEIEKQTLNSTTIEKLDHSPTTIHTSNSTNSTSTSDEVTHHFEFPIIIYTEQKQSQKVASTPIPSTAPVATTAHTANTANTTENTSFIYIPCNHTINEVLKHTFNFTDGDNVTTTPIKYQNSTQSHTDVVDIHANHNVTSNKNTQNDTLSILGSLAMQEIEKLLQHTEMEAMDFNNSTEMGRDTDFVVVVKNNTRTNTPFQHVNVDALESHLNHFIQNKPNTNTAKLPAAKDSQEVKLATEQMNFREPKWFQDTSQYNHETNKDNQYDIPFAKSSSGSHKELVISYTSTTSPNFVYNEIEAHETLFRENELSLHLRNNSLRRRISQDSVVHKKNLTERKKLPLAVKSAIIISGAILALAVLGFFALLLSCKIRQAKSRMKCHRELYREQFQNSEFRQSSRSTSPVVSKSNYNGRSFTNNIQSNVASNRNYYLWQTLRKTFQYD